MGELGSYTTKTPVHVFLGNIPDGSFDASDITAADFEGAAVGVADAGTAAARNLTKLPPALGAIGYYRKPGGKFIVINVPDAQYGVQPAGLNNNNVVTGTYDGIGGFVWPLATRIATEFDCPGPLETFPAAINDKGTITGGCGQYTPDTGFVRDAYGTITTFTPIFKNFGAYTSEVYPQAINKYGTVTGYFLGKSQYGAGLLNHGFIRSKKGNIKVFDYPAAGETYPLAINDNGVVVGWFYDSNNVQHGFERDP